MTAKTQVSIIICTYNAEKTIRGTLNSVTSADLSVPHEIIVVDDASVDSTAAICEEYNVQIMQLQKNQGPAHARNVGVRHSKGDIIIFLDSDVTFPPDLLDKMLEKINRQPFLAGVGSISSPIPLNPNFYSHYFASQEYLNIIRLSKKGNYVRYICTRCGVIKKSVFEELGGFDERYKTPSIEDYQFSLRLPDKYKIYWHHRLINNHHFPDSLFKIWGRYHRNAKEMYLVLKENSNKNIDPYLEDARGRLLIGIAGILFVISLWLPWLAFISLIFLLMAGILKRNLLKSLYQKNGVVYSVYGYIIYMITTIPVVTGIVTGILSHFSANHKK